MHEFFAANFELDACGTVSQSQVKLLWDCWCALKDVQDVMPAMPAGVHLFKRVYYGAKLRQSPDAPTPESRPEVEFLLAHFELKPEYSCKIGWRELYGLWQRWCTVKGLKPGYFNAAFPSQPDVCWLKGVLYGAKLTEAGRAEAATSEGSV